MSETITIILRPEIIYVAGIVNGENVEWDANDVVMSFNDEEKLQINPNIDDIIKRVQIGDIIVNCPS